MDQSFEAEAHPKLLEFIDEHTALSPKTGLLLAAEDLLRLAGHFLAPGNKHGAKGSMALAPALRIGSTHSGYLKWAITGLLHGGPVGAL